MIWLDVLKIKTKILLGVVFFGSFLTTYGFKKYQSFKLAGQAPSEVTIQQLQVKAELRNLHVTLRKHVAAYKDVAYIASGGKLDHVYYPVVSHWPKAKAKIDPKKHFRVLVKTSRFKNRDELKKLPKYRTEKRLTGMVITRFEKSSAAEDERLVKAFKGIDLKTVTVLEEGRKPPTAKEVYGTMTAGVALVLLPLYLSIRRRRR